MQGATSERHLSIQARSGLKGGRAKAGKVRKGRSVKLGPLTLHTGHLPFLRVSGRL